MGNQTTETLLLQVDIVSNNARLAELAAEVRKAREEFAKLQKQVHAGTADAAALDTASVKLKNTLATNAQEARILTNANNAQATANKVAAGSVDELAAKAKILTAQYNALGEQEKKTAAGIALADELKSIDVGLTMAGASASDFQRAIGNYGAAIEPVIAELVKLQEVQKLLPEGSKAYDENILKVKGFQQAVNDAGIKMGLTYEQTLAKLQEISQGIRPIVAELVKLEEEQKSLAEGTEAYTQIGFKIDQAKKSVSDFTDALQDVPEEAKKAGGAISGALGQASEVAEVLGIDIGGLETGFNRAKKGVDIAKNAFGSLGKSMLAIPVFALLAALTALVAYFTKTREGASQLEAVVDKIGAVFDVAIDRAGVLGKAVAQLFSGDYKAAAESLRQSYKGIGDEMQREITLAGNLTKARQQLARDEINNLDTNKKLLNQVERLRNVRDNEFNSIQMRRAANESAYKVELEREKTLVDLAQRKVDLLLAEANRRGGLNKVSDDELRTYKEAQNELADIQEDAAGKQNELITNRFQLTKEAIEKETKLRQDVIKNRIAAIETELTVVKEGSDHELELRQKLIREQAALELVGVERTAADKRLVLAKALQDELKLDEDFDKARQERAAKFLADQDKANATALTYKQGRLAIEAKDQEDAYTRNEQLLQRNLDRRAATLEQDYADGKIKKADYEKQIELLEENGLGARIILQKTFNKDSAQLETQLAKLQGNALRKIGDDQEKEYKARLEIAKEFGVEVGQLFADVLTEQGATLEEFAAKFLILILDIAEKQAIAAATTAVFTSTAGSIAQPDSIATFGATGIARAAILTGIITAAFEVAKAGLSAAISPPKFASGGIVPGTSYEGDRVPVLVNSGEIIMNRRASQELAPVLSHLNSLYGGANFAPGYNPSSVATQQIDGGLMARTIGQNYPSAAEIGREVGKNVPKSIQVKTIKDGIAAYDSPRVRFSL
jgi:hypothetical protein